MISKASSCGEEVDFDTEQGCEGEVECKGGRSWWRRKLMGEGR